MNILTVADHRDPCPHSSLGEFEAFMGLSAAPRHARTAASVARRFLFSAGVNEPAGINEAAISTFLARGGGSVKTRRNRLSALSSFCRFMVQRGLLPDNPCLDIRLAAAPRLPPRYLSADEAGMVLRLARERGIGNEVGLALATGLRLGELIRLRWEDIDAAARSLLVRQSKSGRPRSVPLSAEALTVLAAQREISGRLRQVFPARRTWRGGWRYEDRPRAINWWFRALRPIQEALPAFRLTGAMATGRGWHLFRHTFASRAVQAGVSIYKVASWLGHSDVRTTQIYAHLATTYDPDIELAAGHS